MSKSSESRPDEYDPITYHHWQEFEIRRLKRSSDDFQQLFEDVMVRARPGFIRVRPYGNIGDRKCDGLFRDDSIFFQVYSPDELEQAKVQKKIDEDLDGVVAHWGDGFKTWIFVYNVRRGLPPDIPGTLHEKQKQYPDITIDHLSNDGLWEIARGLSAEQRNEILGLPPSTTKTKQVATLLVNHQEHETSWRETCRELLSHWKGLTTNALMKPNGIRFQLDEIFVPLGVVERREKPKHRSNDGSPAGQGSELYEEKITPISQDDFFEQVLRQRQSKHSQGSRIAIIGEPGAGKTTQLQKIGDWILEETDGMPIWIPLTALGTRKLKDYLLNDWLQTAIQELEVSQEHRDALGQLLKTGKVWLLLDGVDEMAISDALYQIDTQMRDGWLRNVRVVLTCRLNVWDVSKNALDGFDVYRNLDFEYPTEVYQFIDKWFVAESELQQKLKSALEQSGKERIRDMVKNPLRLTLLCYSWKLKQGELPATKAGLYDWFVDAFYEWNKGKAPVKLNSTNRKELNDALGELAKEAIDQASSRFRLREELVNQFLGDADDEHSLFYLALQLGWLNRIGVAEENPLENVYAFLHPTFQEYFAALAISGWEYFLNHITHRLGKGTYRIFKTEWREVFFLWFGRHDLSPTLKEQCINSLMNFQDGCNNFFFYRAIFLAAEAIGETKYLHKLDPILEYLMKWGT
ncbi:MAG: NACHT domain-containing protein, partial [Phormidesmis sp. CAN_BIN44]|nr:NACHT domain-containing protein [Phormidesmis sp. CAN_BIN44]